MGLLERQHPNLIMGAVCTTAPLVPLACACCLSCRSVGGFNREFNCLALPPKPCSQQDQLSVALQSEYAPQCDERRHFISKFTGSAGTAVVTTEAAALWTDGRYFLQVGPLLFSHSGQRWCAALRHGTGEAQPSCGHIRGRQTSKGGST